MFEYIVLTKLVIFRNVAMATFLWIIDEQMFCPCTANGFSYDTTTEYTASQPPIKTIYLRCAVGFVMSIYVYIPHGFLYVLYMI